MARYFLVLTGGIAVAAFYQNCAPGNLTTTSNSVVSSSGALPGGAVLINDQGTNEISLGSEGMTEMTVRSLSVNLEDCSAGNSVLALEVRGGGPALRSCVEPYIPGRANSFRCTDNDYVFLSGLSGWSYNTTTDVWSYSESLRNHNVFVPGVYRTFFKKDEKSYNLNYQLSSSSGSTCVSSSSSSSGSALNCSGLEEAKKQCDQFTASSGSACFVKSQNGDSLHYSPGFGPAKLIQINCSGGRI